MCELYPSRATVAEFSHRKAETTTKQRKFFKNHPTCALKDSHTCCSGLDVRQDTSVLAPLWERSKHCDEGRNSPDFQFLPSGKLLRLATLDEAHTPTLLGGTTKVGGQEEGLKQRGARNRFTMATNLRYAPRTG